MKGNFCHPSITVSLKTQEHTHKPHLLSIPLLTSSSFSGLTSLAYLQDTLHWVSMFLFRPSPVTMVASYSDCFQMCSPPPPVLHSKRLAEGSTLCLPGTLSSVCIKPFPNMLHSCSESYHRPLGSLCGDLSVWMCACLCASVFTLVCACVKARGWCWVLEKRSLP